MPTRRDLNPAHRILPAPEHALTPSCPPANDEFRFEGIENSLSFKLPASMADWNLLKKLARPTPELLGLIDSRRSRVILVIKYSHHAHQVAAIEKWKLIRSRTDDFLCFVQTSNDSRWVYGSERSSASSIAILFIFKLFSNKCLSQTKEFCLPPELSSRFESIRNYIFSHLT